MKVLFIHHSGSYGGSSRSLGILIPYLQDLGIEAYVVSPSGKVIDYFKSKTDHVFSLNPDSFPLPMSVVGMDSGVIHLLSSFRRIINIGRIRKIVLAVKPDIVHCNESGLYPIGKMVKKLGIPVVMHARTMPNKKNPCLNKYHFNQVKTYANHTFCITESVSNAYSSIVNKSVVYNPIESLPIPQVRYSEKDEIIFLSLSAIQESKGVYDIIEAAKILKDHKNIKFQIAGGLNSLTTNNLTLKQKLLVKLGVLNFETSNRIIDLIKIYKLENVDLLGHIENIDQCIKKADVIIAPMHLNAPPRSVYEGAAHGLPSILSMEDKVNDVVKNNTSGIIIDEKAPDQLANAILKLANDGVIRIEMGKAARRICEKNHSPKKSAYSIFKTYRKVLSK